MQKLKKKKKPRQFFVRSDRYLTDDAQFYKSLKIKRSSDHFVFAFNLRKRFKRWSKDAGMSSIDAYLEELFDEIEDLPYGKSSMKLDYYTADRFPDLVDPVKRKISFWCYREIANSGIKEYQMRRIRLWAEKIVEAPEVGKIGPKKIREEIEKIYKKPKYLKPKELFFTHHTLEDSKKRIDNFFKKYKKVIIPQTRICISATPPRREEETTENL